ncbi:DUF202 domain-containing protein [Arthrobacter bambusae]|uniref:DUF202 domain-containing protein n=1 Tax=Arthrobacter bambusae TaxID=1338426 RepID=UPI0027D875F7|nr:DUF202 domain-containing protein [Arthrobacter bambusae]
MKTGQDSPNHKDPGLQPERTDLAWRRTGMSLLAAAAVFLRWMPHHGWFVGTLILAAVAVACAINLTHRRRFRRAAYGISRGNMPPDTVSTAVVAASVGILALLGIYTVLFLPLQR